MTDLGKALNSTFKKIIKDQELPGSTKVFEGSLEVKEEFKTKGKIINTTGQELMIGAGESGNMMDFNTDNSETVTVVAEQGFKIYSSPNNWVGSDSQYSQAEWDQANKAIICDPGGRSAFPNSIHITGADDDKIVLTANDSTDYVYTLFRREDESRAWEVGMMSDHNKWFIRGKNTDSTNPKDLLLCDYNANEVTVPTLLSSKITIDGATTNYLTMDSNCIWFGADDADGVERQAMLNYVDDGSRLEIKMGEKDSENTVFEIWEDGKTDFRNNISIKNENSADTWLRVETSASDKKAVLKIGGTSDATQATGMLLISQDNENYGGGLEYNGDNDPSTTGAGEDYLALFRVDGGDYAWTARNKYNSNDWEFAGEITESSDERLKENIETLEGSLDKVLSIRGVKYNKIKNPGNVEIGFIAQEIENIVPEIVNTDESEDGMKSVSYSRTVALLVEAMKEQQEMIASLTERVKELEEK